MGQQQLLLIILGVIIVGIAIAVGLSMFTAQSVGAQRDAIISDITNLAANAYQHRIRPASMGGGGGVYDNSAGGTTYVIPSRLVTNENGIYTLEGAVAANQVAFRGSAPDNAADYVVGTYDGNGRLVGSFGLNGKFQ
ncbi:MAG: hypothetical protein FJ215_05690 [Ignavibacteria bacterium]|nr:hypothetical protein [Ignavibacteria bacterium]